MSDPPPTVIQIPLTLGLFSDDVAMMLVIIMTVLIVTLAVALTWYNLFGRGGRQNPVLNYIGPKGPTGPLSASDFTGPTGVKGATGNNPVVFSTGSTGASGRTGPTGPQGQSLGSPGLTGATGPTGPSQVGATGATPSGPTFGFTSLFPRISFYTSDNVTVMTGRDGSLVNMNELNYLSMGTFSNMPFSSSSGNGGLRVFLGQTGANYGSVVATIYGYGWIGNSNERLVAVGENADYLAFYLNDYISGSTRPLLKTDVVSAFDVALEIIF